MVHLDLLGIAPQQMNVVFEFRSRPESLYIYVSSSFPSPAVSGWHGHHMLLDGFPPNRCHRCLPSNTLSLYLFVRDSNSNSQKAIRLLFEHLPQFYDFVNVTRRWGAIEVKGSNLGPGM